MKKYLLGSSETVSSAPLPSGALLLLRIVAGVAFMLHGWGKIQNPLGWMGPESPVPGIFQLAAALSEFGGGLLWILGLLTPVASVGILATMVVAVFVHVGRGDAFVGGWELATVYLVIAVVLLLVGPGRFSADAKICQRC
jgi:putative oxidoreductase